MTIDRYLLRLWVGPFMGGIFFVLAVMLVARALKLLGAYSDNPETWSLIASLLLLTMPFFLLQIVPAAFFLSLQNTISGLQQHSEMDALRASGLSYRRMFRAFFVVAALLWGGLTYISMVMMPEGQLGFNNIIARIYAMQGSISFAPQRFTQGLGGVSVYVDGEDEQGVYHGVILEDHRNGSSVIYSARSARFEMGASYLLLKLSDGVRLEGEGADQRMLAFQRYQVSIPVPDATRRVLHSFDHVTMMTVSELWHKLQSGDNHAAAVAEWNRRLLLPSTVLVLLFFALPLSLTRKRSGKAGAMIAGIVLLLLIYNMQLVLHQQVSQGTFPGWTMWLGQCVVLLIGLYLSRRAEEDRLPALFMRLVNPAG
ncbi:YjgP/YjgQ family permease [Mariprofundus erugo]|uniref:LptF/LptG family permease n=1 Tax=Mariprofundus erugo TaxID=2528639 RepID=UPI0010FD1D67|nr:LptF/LptG family permease [Mariprofundus erugo]TLS78328.1 YjgP/YjgQ family permease [Mariprofundus erugo]